MDREQQIRLNFLDETENYLDQIESVLLNLHTKIAETQELDLALRAAHSLKGGAGMMGFSAMSQVAHRLEDFFKILRVRYHSTQISLEVETLLLKAVDALREISQFHRQSQDIDDSYLTHQVAPIFDHLQQHLGDIQDDDENKIFSLNEDADAELVMFEEEVETILERFEQQLNETPASQLPDLLLMTSEELVVFSQMANLDPFTQLCESIQQQVSITNIDHIPTLAQEALDIWKRSHALVSRGSIEKLPSQLEHRETLEIDPFPQEIPDEFPTPDWADSDISTLDNIESFDLDLTQVEAELASIDDQSLEQLESELALIAEDNFEEFDLTLVPSDFAIEEISILKELTPPPITPKKEVFQFSDQTGKMVKVPVEQLYKFNNLFSKLILERNTLNQSLAELKNFALLMRRRMEQLEQSNNQLRKWYDRASIEGILPVTEPVMLALSSVTNNEPLNNPDSKSQNGEFDILEMDRYTDLHLISQDQIETIVQLKEVTTDIDTGLQEMTQAMGELNQTTRSLQINVTRTQMTPFSEVVNRFPRMVRDFSVQFDKKVNLKIEGETTLIDRAILETLNAPLTHLLRNAFDHGIENPSTRIANGKSPEGTIMIKAVNRVSKTIITIQDDGGGIPLDKICDRLLKRGISKAQINKMSQSEILNYIFEPGFSTTDTVTELSGRGIGMDVVRTNLREIRGDIQVQTSPGSGTTFTLTVPFSLSILRVMLLERAGIIFAVPINSIREIIRFTASEISVIETLEELRWHNHTIPVIRLEQYLIFNRAHKSFQMQGNPIIDKTTVLVIGEETSIAGIYLDRVWGEQEVTIRSIDSPIPLPRGFNSSIVLGDGRVIPLVDPVEVLEGCLEIYQDNSHNHLNSLDQNIKQSRPQEQVKTILIVDDSINVRNYLALTLERAGYHIEQAKDGQEAVDKLFNGLSVQAVICDIEMPRLDGYGVLEEVKGKSEFKHLPIAMLTSRSNEKHRKLAMNLGASAYFSKPYNEQELLQKLMELIEQTSK